MMEDDENLLDEDNGPIKNLPLIYGWGRNDDGELAVPSTKTVIYPSASKGFRGYARQIATARSHSVVLN